MCLDMFTPVAPLVSLVVFDSVLKGVSFHAGT